MNEHKRGIPGAGNTHSQDTPPEHLQQKLFGESLHIPESKTNRVFSEYPIKGEVQNAIGTMVLERICESSSTRKTLLI